MEPIKLGIIGLGRAGRGMHLKELEGKEDIYKIVAVCDLIKERRDEVAAQFNCKAYEDMNDLINDPEVELVDIATRSCDHYAHAKLALQAGKNVFLEKPMSINYSNAKELAEMGSGTPHLYIRHNRRWEDKFVQVNEIIDSGILGEIFEVKLTRNSFQLRNDWQTISSYGGGQLLNWGPHIVDHAMRFCGGDYTNLYACTKQINASGDCEDTIKAVFTGINGRIVDMEICCATALRTPEYTLYGTRGTLIDNGESFSVKYIKPGCELEKKPADPGTPMGGFGAPPQIEWIEEDIPYKKTGKLDQTWGAVYADFREGKPYLIKLDEAVNNIRAIEAIKLAAHIINR